MDRISNSIKEKVKYSNDSRTAVEITRLLVSNRNNTIVVLKWFSYWKMLRIYV